MTDGGTLHLHSEYDTIEISKKSYLKLYKMPQSNNFQVWQHQNPNVVILKTQPATNMHRTPPTLQPSKLLKTIGITTVYRAAGCQQKYKKKRKLQFYTRNPRINVLKEEKSIRIKRYCWPYTFYMLLKAFIAIKKYRISKKLSVYTFDKANQSYMAKISIKS